VGKTYRRERLDGKLVLRATEKAKGEFFDKRQRSTSAMRDEKGTNQNDRMIEHFRRKKRVLGETM